VVRRVEVSPTRTAQSRLLDARLALVGAGMLWSLGGVCIKSLTAGPVAIAGYRCLFAAMAVLPFLRRGEWPPWRELAVSVGLYGLMLVTYIAAVQGTTAANANLLQYTAPIYVILLSPWLLGERVRREDARAVGVSLVGVAILFAGNWRGAEARGLVLGLLSGLLFGVFMLWQRRLRASRPVALVFANNLGAALLVLPFAGADLAPGGGALGLLAFMGVVQFGIPYLLFTWGLQRVPGPEASLLTLVEPVLTPLWVALVVGERPTVATLIGGAFILAALGLRYAGPRSLSSALARQRRIRLTTRSHSHESRGIEQERRQG
jgi:DME family drug/metabolite transporter